MDAPSARSSDLSSWKEDPSEAVLQFWKQSRSSFSLYGRESATLAYLLAKALKAVRKPILAVTPSDREAEMLADRVEFFLGPESRAQSPLDRLVWRLPSRSDHKLQRLGKMEATARRMEALYALKASSASILVVASAPALLEKLPPPDVMTTHSEYLVPGEEINTEALVRRLIQRGYFRASLVEDYGDISRRGDIVDVYTPLYKWPVRMEFFGDELESIRMFHPGTQRSMGHLEDVVLLPATEIILDDTARQRVETVLYQEVEDGVLTPLAANAWLEKLDEGYSLTALEPVFSAFYEETTSVMDYLPPEASLVWTDVHAVHQKMEEWHAAVQEHWETSRSIHEWRRPPRELYETPEDILESAEAFQQVWLNPLTGRTASRRSFKMGDSGHEALKQAVKEHPQRERLLEPVARQLRDWQQEGMRLYFVCSRKEQARRMAELFNDYGVDAFFSSQPFGEESFDAPAVKVMSGSLEKGFLWPAERLAVVCEQEIFERKQRRRRSDKSVSGIFLSSFQDLNTGDYVVHVDHGIGVYRGLAHLDVGDTESDFLLLDYQNGDRLYVPVDKFQKIQKYMGIEGRAPRVDKLGGKSWETAKKKARESAEKIAEELLQLYAKRQVNQGHRFSPPDSLYREFEATFAYDETPDQVQAIEDVLGDMTSEQPMDRLICGDVGYGKTEVALRAAFKAVLDGKQAGILVPTTVLAEQHFQTFRERFEGFPIEVEVLSRFKTPSQQKKILEGLKNGTIDIVVGTHRLLQKDVAFKELGLLIIDEEHRFGVKHKEKLKALRVSVDVLTLTATPIPRTLHMSLSGIRDLSTIETPPQDRHAIETYVCKYDDLIVREAIYRELHRHGQVFFVHNHVQTIHQLAVRLGRMVPEARIAVAHGQMKERELEKVMMDFIRKKVDVLVCTTIIESGLDIPAANTIIINRADRFGLAQIYQLRGRVGRSSEQAYAYLLIPGEHLVSRDAQKRLRALMDFSELGAGFKIALNDLQIRGGGAILGSAQSGHVQAVGYELYLELLEKTIRELKGEETEREAVDPEINVRLSVFLPESFIPDTDQRLLAYKRLAVIDDGSAINDLALEWRDRYGPLPNPAKQLLLMASLRLLLKRLRIVRLDADEHAFILRFQTARDLERVVEPLGAVKPEFSVSSPETLVLEIGRGALSRRLAHLKRILQQLCERVTDSET